MIKTKQRRLTEAKSEEMQCYLLLLLPIAGFLIFTIYPTIWAAIKAFYYYDGTRTTQHFVGLQNFINAMFDGGYWAAWKNTLLFMIMKLPLEILFALVIAVAIQNMKGGGVFRAIFFFPQMVSTVIAGVLFGNIFSYFGFLNAFLAKVGLVKEGIDWFGTYGGAMTVLVIVSFWQCIGTNILYFSAALANVPKEVYEAATIDGANPFVKFFKITIPSIGPVFQTILLLGINGTLQTGEFVVILTGGNPAGKTNLVMSYIIQKFIPGFATGTVNIGYGCAMSLISSVMFALIAIIYIRMTKRLQDAV